MGEARLKKIQAFGLPLLFDVTDSELHLLSVAIQICPSHNLLVYLESAKGRSKERLHETLDGWENRRITEITPTLSQVQQSKNQQKHECMKKCIKNNHFDSCIMVGQLPQNHSSPPS